MDKIDEILNNFKLEREFDGIKPNTIRNDLLRLRIFLEYTFNELKKTPETMEYYDFMKFFIYLENERGLKRNTLNRYFNLLRVFYDINRLKNFDEFIETTKRRKRFKRFQIIHYDYLDEKTYKAILKKIKSNGNTAIRNTLIIKMLWDTGCRISELLNIRYKDCNFKEGIFRITNTKNYEERIVACSEKTLDELKFFIEYNVNQSPDATIFQTPKGKLSKNTIQHVFINAVKELKAEGIIPQNKRIVLHSLRHSRAVNLLDKGVSIDIVKEYLGHKNIKTTLIYSHPKERIEREVKDLRNKL